MIIVCLFVVESVCFFYSCLYVNIDSNDGEYTKKKKNTVDNRQWTEEQVQATTDRGPSFFF